MTSTKNIHHLGTTIFKQDPRIPTEIYLDSYELKKVQTVLDQYGVCVVKNYFPTEQATDWKNKIIDWLCSLSDDLDQDLPASWKTKNMPYGPRLGMMQSLISHCPTVWQIRLAMYQLFCDLHDTEELYTSIDGASVHPPIFKSHAKDWPHIDQTTEGLYCVQGQAVLSDTTAAFRCTPGSHHRHREILELCHKIGEKSEWLKFNDDQVTELRKQFFSDDQWQLPIYAPTGSIILWRSNTIHSAQRNTSLQDKGWRCVVYVCMRPADQYTKSQKGRLQKCFQEGRTTNHWGTKMFSKRPGLIYGKPNRHSSIERVTDYPTSIALQEPNEMILKLVGITDYEKI